MLKSNKKALSGEVAVLRINLTLVPSETILQGLALHRLLADFAGKSFFFHLICILATANLPTHCQLKVSRLLLCVHISMEIIRPIKCGKKNYISPGKYIIVSSKFYHSIPFLFFHIEFTEKLKRGS